MSEICVEVAYARPDEQALINVTVPEASTVENAIRQSGILEQFPEIDLQQTTVGIFSKLVT
ncbi:MAG: RnfH family protein, partial [Pseudomonadota bacterium]